MFQLAEGMLETDKYHETRFVRFRFDPQEKRDCHRNFPDSCAWCLRKTSGDLRRLMVVAVRGCISSDEQGRFSHVTVMSVLEMRLLPASPELATFHCPVAGAGLLRPPAAL